MLPGWLDFPSVRSVRGPAVRRPKQAVPTRLQWIVTGNFEDRVSDLHFPAQGSPDSRLSTFIPDSGMDSSIFSSMANKEVLFEPLSLPVTRHSEREF